MFEIMRAPANVALHRYIKDLAHVRMEIAALQMALQHVEGDEAVKTLGMRIKEERETVTS